MLLQKAVPEKVGAAHLDDHRLGDPLRDGPPQRSLLIVVAGELERAALPRAIREVQRARIEGALHDLVRHADLEHRRATDRHLPRLAHRHLAPLHTGRGRVDDDLRLGSVAGRGVRAAVPLRVLDHDAVAVDSLLEFDLEGRGEVGVVAGEPPVRTTVLGDPQLDPLRRLAAGHVHRVRNRHDLLERRELFLRHHLRRNALHGQTTGDLLVALVPCRVAHAEAHPRSREGTVRHLPGVVAGVRSLDDRLPHLPGAIGDLDRHRLGAREFIQGLPRDDEFLAAGERCFRQGALDLHLRRGPVEGDDRLRGLPRRRGLRLRAEVGLRAHLPLPLPRRVPAGVVLTGRPAGTEDPLLLARLTVEEHHLVRQLRLIRLEAERHDALGGDPGTNLRFPPEHEFIAGQGTKPRHHAHGVCTSLGKQVTTAHRGQQETDRQPGEGPATAGGCDSSVDSRGAQWNVPSELYRPETQGAEVDTHPHCRTVRTGTSPKGAELTHFCQLFGDGRRTVSERAGSDRKEPACFRSDERAEVPERWAATSCRARWWPTSSRGAPRRASASSCR